MQFFITASSDTYITDKIIENSYRSKKSNVGNASSLDLFKLFEESGVLQNGSFVTEDISEISKILLKFDYSPILRLTSSNLNIRSFKAYLELKDISSGIQKPFRFSAVCNPLKNIFEEGFGMDVNRFDDLGSANFITSSYLGNSPILWKSEGASAGGGTGEVKAVGRITVTAEAGWVNNPTFSLNDGTNTVIFSRNAGSETPARTNATSYTYGTQNVPEGGLTVLAKRLYDSIDLAKNNSDLNITASDPSAPEVDLVFIVLTQDAIGPTGNTDIVAQNNADAFTVINFSGGYDETHLDFITSGSNGAQVVDFGSTCFFENPNDNAVFDVTTAVSASVKNIIQNNGFRVAFSGSFETDNKTRFVKRFASRHVSDKNLVPILRIKYDSSLVDKTDSIFLDKQSTLYLKNYVGVDLENLIDQAGNEIIGDNCGKLTISSGSFSETFDFSQALKSSDSTRLKGTYFSNVTVSSNNAFVKKALIEKSEDFKVSLKWQTNDLTKILHEEDTRVKNTIKNSIDLSQVILSFSNSKNEYSTEEDVEIEISATINGHNHRAKKVSTLPDSLDADLFYSIEDLQSGQKIIDFDKELNSTMMSRYRGSFSFKILNGTLGSGRSYSIKVAALQNEKFYVFDESFLLRIT